MRKMGYSSLLSQLLGLLQSRGEAFQANTAACDWIRSESVRRLAKALVGMPRPYLSRDNATALASYSATLPLCPIAEWVRGGASSISVGQFGAWGVFADAALGSAARDCGTAAVAAFSPGGTPAGRTFPLFRVCYVRARGQAPLRDVPPGIQNVGMGFRSVAGILQRMPDPSLWSCPVDE